MTAPLKQQMVGAHVRRLRTDRGLSLRALAAETGFSPSFMSQVENGQVSPSISSMEKIAAALGVSLGEFFMAAAQGEGGLIIRAGAGAVLSSWWSSAEVESLSPMRAAQKLEPLLITLEPGGRSGKHPYPHAREEFGFVVEGQVSLTLGPETHLLNAGDAAMILPKELRLWDNTSGARARVLIVSLRSSSAVKGEP